MNLSRLTFVYGRQFPKVIVYMLQSTEYGAGAYLRWFWRVNDFRSVMRRRQLEHTKPARLLLGVLRAGIVIQILLALLVMGLTWRHPSLRGLMLAFLLLITAPIIWAHLIVVPLLLGRWLLIKPVTSRRIKASRKTFENHPAEKIAVAGSYGKTSMKEMLLAVLSEGKKVAATEANKNVAVSHAAFARKLTGDEDILIIEYGEGAPGDVARFVRNTKPTLGIITGLAPAHLDKYKSLQAAGEDIFTLASYLGDKNVYVNGDSPAGKPFTKKGYITYTAEAVGQWRISDVRVSIEGTSFTMKKAGQTLKIKTAALGKHQIGPIAAVCAIADRLGLSKGQIEAGTAKIKAFEHRMQAYRLNGAWIIDDTYNGNIDGMRAGLELLRTLPAKKRIYITPGLVDQGPETKKVHRQLGEMIAAADVDELFLMRNSVTEEIVKGLSKSFKGRLTEVDEPLFFYENLDKIVAAGDLVVMQNDWTDNYQ